MTYACIPNSLTLNLKIHTPQYLVHVFSLYRLLPFMYNLEYLATCVLVKRLAILNDHKAFPLFHLLLGPSRLL